MESTLIESIVNCEEELLKAMREHDAEKLDQLLHDDLLFVIPTGQTITKAMDLDNLRSGKVNIEEVSPSDQNISLIEDAAIVSVLIHLKGTFFGQSIVGDFRYIRTWKQFDDQWKVIGGAGISL